MSLKKYYAVSVTLEDKSLPLKLYCKDIPESTQLYMQFKVADVSGTFVKHTSTRLIAHRIIRGVSWEPRELELQPC